MKLLNNIKTFIKIIIKKIIKMFFPNFFETIIIIKNLNNKISEIENQLQDLQSLLNNLSGNLISERQLAVLFKYQLGYELDFQHPKTFNQKLQWLKLNYRHPIMTKLADKYLVREYLKEKGLEKYLNELLGVYNEKKEFEIDFVNLPDSFVIKVNHWSGDTVIIKNKDNFNWQKFYDLCELLKKNYYYHPAKIQIEGKILPIYLEEWPYKNIKPCIIVEKYLEENNGKLLDYKIFCFDGRPHYIQIDVDRHTNHTRCFYNLKWEKQPFTTLYPYYNGEIPKPKNLEEMLFVAEKLSECFPHMRVDLYNINQEKIIFGELTFYHGSGFEKFYPEEWDLKLGELISII